MPRDHIVGFPPRSRTRAGPKSAARLPVGA